MSYIVTVQPGRIHHNGKNIGVRRAQKIGEREAELVSCDSDRSNQEAASGQGGN